MSRRYFSETIIRGHSARLIGPEAQHLAKVMRANVGDEVTLFDGMGSEFTATIESIGRGEVCLTITEELEVDREPARRTIVGASLPKGDRQRWLVEKLVELGVSSFVPLATQRSVAQPTGKALDRLRRYVIEASKQCGRNRLMLIEEAESLESFLEHADDETVRCFAHPGAGAKSLAQSRVLQSPTISMAIGPEGGFSDEEANNAADRGWQWMQLGPRVLRTETAAVAIASYIALSEDADGQG